MVEYRHNKEWNTMFFKKINPNDLKLRIETYTEINLLGDIEVVDVHMTSFVTPKGITYYDILVFYVLLKKTAKVKIG